MAVSTFTWLDHRDDDSQRVREALAAFDERGMIDPLGFGPVRDALSDILFPGISTIQTRARYFLMVPWIYQSLDADGIRPDEGAQVVRERELAFVESLLRGSADHNGIIGRVSRQALKQVPSFIYWGGLGTWGIRQFDGTRYDYIASLSARRRAHARADDIDGSLQAGNPWHPGLPAAPTDLLDAATLDLTRDEALFLQGRILDTVPDSFLAVLVRDGTTDLDADAPWEHPLADGPDPNYGNRVNHVLRHTVDDPNRVVHGVFSGDRHVFDVVDDAYVRSNTSTVGVVHEPPSPAGVRGSVVTMDDPVGYVGGSGGAVAGNPASQHVNLVVRNGNQAITAYPTAGIPMGR
jgi:Family of unknown function (DUF6361)